MSLTDSWKAGKLKAGAYYVKLSNGRVDVAKLSKFNRFYTICCTFEVVEVIAPCDYEELKRVRDENNDLSALVTSNEIEIAHLRQLLKECKDWLNWAYVELQEYDEDHKSPEIDNLLTEINKVLK